MLSKFAKVLFVGTSLTPIFFICAAISAIQGAWTQAASYALLTVALASILSLLLWLAKKDIPPAPLPVTKFKPADKEVLAFLVSYLIPFIPRTSAAFGGEILSAVLIVAVIGVTVYHSNAYTFNPLLALRGYRFYEVESGNVTYLLVSRQWLSRPGRTIQAKHLCDYLYIDDSPPVTDDDILPAPSADKAHS